MYGTGSAGMLLFVCVDHCSIW